MELKEVLKTQEISPYYKLKSIFLGNQGVGKSSIVKLINPRHYDDDLKPTVGIEFISLNIELKEYLIYSEIPPYYFEMKRKMSRTQKDNQLIKLDIWDCAGSHRFISIVESYLRDVDIVFFVYDIGDRKSWDDLEIWKKKLDNNKKYDFIPLYYIIGTKSDLHCNANNNVVSEEKIQERCKNWNAKSYKFSSKYDNSYRIMREIIYNSLIEYHEKIRFTQYSGEEIPEHLLVSYYDKSIKKIVDNKKSNSCCFQ